jgi:hypothetical protein
MLWLLRVEVVRVCAVSTLVQPPTHSRPGVDALHHPQPSHRHATASTRASGTMVSAQRLYTYRAVTVASPGMPCCGSSKWCGEGMCALCGFDLASGSPPTHPPTGCTTHSPPSHGAPTAMPLHPRVVPWGRHSVCTHIVQWHHMGCCGRWNIEACIMMHSLSQPNVSSLSKA